MKYFIVECNLMLSRIFIGCSINNWINHLIIFFQLRFFMKINIIIMYKWKHLESSLKTDITPPSFKLFRFRWIFEKEPTFFLATQIRLHVDVEIIQYYVLISRGEMLFRLSDIIATIQECYLKFKIWKNIMTKKSSAI